VIVCDLGDKGTLEKFVNGKPIPEEMAIGIFEQILEGLNAFHTGTGAPHSKKGMHRDIISKTYIDGSHDVKIGDFGNSVLEGETVPGIVGTTFYISREVNLAFYWVFILKRRLLTPKSKSEGLNFDFRADFWSLDLVLYEMLWNNSLEAP
jgi:serine/threonine protein kinase